MGRGVRILSKKPVYKHRIVYSGQEHGEHMPDALSAFPELCFCFIAVKTQHNNSLFTCLHNFNAYRRKVWAHGDALFTFTPAIFLANNAWLNNHRTSRKKYQIWNEIILVQSSVKCNWVTGFPEAWVFNQSIILVDNFPMAFWELDNPSLFAGDM
jgi:hypothetical protein